MEKMEFFVYASFIGVFWLAAYVLIIYRGFKDKSYGMPLVALGLNIMWELIFGLGIHNPVPLDWGHVNIDFVYARNFLWFLFDVAILASALMYGKQYIKHEMVKKYFAPLVFMGIGLSFLLQHYFILEFYIPNAHNIVVNGATPEFFNLSAQGGYIYTGFLLNLIMSPLFVMMALNRPNMAGQSLYIALAKMFGSFAAYLLMVAGDYATPFCTVMYIPTLAFDIVYTAIVYHRLKEEGFNPWKRA